MSLLSSARALDDEHFLWRVRAALLNMAISKYNAVSEIDKKFAREILDDPTAPNRTMEALVASSSAISNAITVDSAGTVNTSAVTDEQINAAILTYWAPVAARREELRNSNISVI